MKRFLPLLLALAMIIALVACGNNAANKDNGGSQNNTPNDNNGNTESSDADLPDNSDLQSILDKGTLVVGVTAYEPMDYQVEGSEEWVGFDADMAKTFAEYLHVDIAFKTIAWSERADTLNDKTIDCVWNGMTLDEDVMASMTTSVPYCSNFQVLVYSSEKAAAFQDITSLEGLNVAAEAGSAGENAASSLHATVVPAETMADALAAVADGTTDAAVIDVIIAAAMTGENGAYADLTYDFNLNSVLGIPDEECGVGFRQGSDLAEAFNLFWSEKASDGTALAIATAYGLENVVILD